jgi:glycosyltransferase involved in cell wall biosynthesis
MTADLIVFGEDWGRHPSSTQHIVRRLARGRRVLYVNSIGMRRPRLTLSDMGRAARKLRAAFGRDQTVRSELPEGLSILAPLALPWPGNRLARHISAVMLSRALNRAMDRKGFDRPVVWTSLPTAFDTIAKLDGRATIYYCGDDFSALAGVNHKPVAALERQLAERADLILAVTPALAAKFPASKTVLMPHGADIDLFRNPAPRAADLPSGRPIAGYYGSIAEWLDIPLLETVARQMPDWDFVFIGDNRHPVDRLAALPTVRFLGARPHHELPSYSQHWDVALLPFLDTSQIRACDPLKLREYLATGRPVVATPFPAVEAYGSLVATERSPERFAAAIRASLKEPAGSGLRRIDHVANDTWEARAAEAAAVIDGL